MFFFLSFIIFSVSFLLQLLESFFGFPKSESEDEFLTGIKLKSSLIEDEIVGLLEELELSLRNVELKMLPILLYLSENLYGIWGCLKEIRKERKEFDSCWIVQSGSHWIGLVEPKLKGVRTPLINAFWELYCWKGKWFLHNSFHETTVFKVW